ncbi:hypothetical protein SAMN05421823_102633 [Catalinimonas alkaloidigena]|uniref:Uncharacterized protein n=1 Tax=Catalinimonas alkaloidigena TaxID=1075417 RepID=A0A1G9BJ91_9BACT|nr:hypothetical protein [Catalinimonas alkaloidigena]SDK39588.1 hypothetical protein SAMN05421823_102633 [Catalinimonas alkaloidigena]
MKKNYFQRWLLFGLTGLLLVGIGLGLLVEAIHLRMNQAAFAQWAGVGLTSLSAVVLGLTALGESVVNRVFYKLRNRQRSAS